MNFFQFAKTNNSVTRFFFPYVQPLINPIPQDIKKDAGEHLKNCKVTKKGLKLSAE